MPIRMFHLADELKISSFKLVELCPAVGIEEKRYSLQTIDDDEAELLRLAVRELEHAIASEEKPTELSELAIKIRSYFKQENERRSAKSFLWFVKRLASAIDEHGWDLLNQYSANSGSVYLRFQRQFGSVVERRRIRVADHFTKFENDLAASLVIASACFTPWCFQKKGEQYPILVVDTITVYKERRQKEFLIEPFFFELASASGDITKLL